MKIGYACIAIGVPNTNKRTCTMKTATEENLINIIKHNLIALDKMIDYNIENKIDMMRIGSELIPFGSSFINQLKWWETFYDQFKQIGTKIKNNDIRVSMHPGQYTVLNSYHQEVVTRAIADLEYHNRILDTLGVDSSHKIILHIGGIYQDKPLAKERFIQNYQSLSDGIKRRLVIENDDKAYNISDVLEISHILNIPVVFDNLHNAINPSKDNLSDVEWIKECAKTWQLYDGTPKIHYSQQALLKQVGTHSSTIKINDFMDFYQRVKECNVDIMLEVKDKNLSALKCINTISDTKNLEKEWANYQYLIWEHSYDIYQQINHNLHHYSSLTFYNLIESALKLPKTYTQDVTLALWNLVQDKANDQEKTRFANLFSKQVNLKHYLYNLTMKYQLPNNLFYEEL